MQPDLVVGGVVPMAMVDPVHRADVDFHIPLIVASVNRPLRIEEVGSFAMIPVSWMENKHLFPPAGGQYPGAKLRVVPDAMQMPFRKRVPFGFRFGDMRAGGDLQCPVAGAQREQVVQWQNVGVKNIHAYPKAAETRFSAFFLYFF
jgi:hypothetical protein